MRRKDIDRSVMDTLAKTAIKLLSTQANETSERLKDSYGTAIEGLPVSDRKTRLLLF